MGTHRFCGGAPHAKTEKERPESQNLTSGSLARALVARRLYRRSPCPAKQEARDVVAEADHRRLGPARLVFRRRPFVLARTFGFARRMIDLRPLALAVPCPIALPVSRAVLGCVDSDDRLRLP
jgi:hypothetical protein